MFNSSTNSSRIRSKSSSNTRCQTLSLATESRFQITVRVTMADRFRKQTPHVRHSSPDSCSRWPRVGRILASQPRLEATSRLPERTRPSHFAFLASHRALQESAAVRHCSAFAPLASPPRKRVALFVSSCAVTYSTSSTSQLRQLDCDLSDTAAPWPRR